MRTTKYLIAVTAGTAVTVAVGLAYGYISQRWGPSPDLVAAGEQLKQFPDSIGPWVIDSSEPIDELTLRMLACTGYVNRRYTHRATGETVAVAVVVGPSGPIAVHTPEICYSSRAYSVEDSGVRTEIRGTDSRQHSFWRATFQPTRIGEDRLRVYYAWNDGTTWQAATWPRFQYGPAPMLYKIQVGGPLRSEGDKEDEDAAHDFLDELMNSEWSPAGDPANG